jgi:hypothetical protein
MSAPVARPPLVRRGPGVAAWTALPERDRALLLWLVQADVVTAELAALLAYGHRRIAQRRLARLTEYGLLAGFWAANRQRPRGRYAYALTKIARSELERLVWPAGRPTLPQGVVETVSPVIHQLATHDLLAAFLRASDPGAGIGLCAWLSERPLVRLTHWGTLRPDAIALLAVGERTILVCLERDLGTERGSTLSDKVHRYRQVFDGRRSSGPLHVGLVVEGLRRAASVRRSLREQDEGDVVRVWVVTEPELRSAPYAAIWVSPTIEPCSTVELAPYRTGEPWPILRPGCLAEPDTLGALDERVIGDVPLLRSVG